MRSVMPPEQLARRMATAPVPDGVKIVDFGIRGVHLAYELLDGYDVAILVDAMPSGEPVGTVSVLVPEFANLSDPDVPQVASVDATSQPDGRWTIPGILGGRYRLRAWRAPDMALTVPQILLARADEVL